MSQSASRRSLSLSNIARAVGLLFAGLTTLIVTAAPEPGTIEIRGPEGQSVIEEREQAKRFGPVQPSDTLWRIASITRPAPSISVYQMMYAFYHKNPDAFEGGNIHKLSRGAILLIPTAEEARLFSVQQASSKLRADQTLLSQEKELVVAPTSEGPAKPVKATEQPQVADVKPSPELPAEVSEPAKPEIDQAAIEQAERERKIYEAQMRELKNDLADSIGSIEALLTQNRTLVERVEDLSGTIVTLESELAKEKEQADMARRQLLAQAESTQAEVKNLIENPPISSMWLWGLSAGLALVFGLIGWLMLRHRKEPEVAAPIATSPLETAPQTGGLPEQEVEAEPEEVLEEEEDVLLDLGLDESDSDDELVDLSLDEPDVPDMVDLDSLDVDESDAFDEPEEMEDLLARDSDLSEPETSAEVDDVLMDLDNDIPEMQDIQTLDLDLESEGGELTQEALDALAAMDDFDEADDEQQEESSMDSLEEAFDAIGQPEPIPDEDDLEVKDAILSIDEDAEAAADEFSAELDEVVEQASEPNPLEEGLDALDDEELDIDALLSETQAEGEELEALATAEDTSGEETAAEVDDIDALLEESAPVAEPEELADVDDIDALLEESAPVAEPEELADVDDIDALLEESAPVAEPEELAAVDDIDALLEEAAAESLDEVGGLAELDVESDDDLLDLDSLLDAGSEEEPLTEDVVDDASIDISNLLSGEPEPEPEPQSDRAMTAEELEQEFDLANVADELLAEAGEEEDLSAELAAEQEVLPEQDLEQHLAQLGAELDDVPSEPEEFVDIDQLLAEAENAEPEADDDLFSTDEEGLELEDEDEISAKLDLARAYIEIGDKDVATKLLQEIIQNESGEHQREAQELLDRL